MKLRELDILRAGAILAVVLIHATSQGVGQLPSGTDSHTLYFIVNTLSSFAVPVFLFVSGLVLFYRYTDKWDGKQIGIFYYRRLRSVLIPYLLCSIAYYFFRQLLADPITLFFDWKAFVKLLPWGKAYYQLYFMVIIIQFYLLFPIIMTAVKSSAFIKRHLLTIGWVLQLAFYSYHHWVEPVPHRAALAMTYIALFCSGAWIGMNYRMVHAWLMRYSGFVLLLTVATGVFYTGMFLQNSIRFDMFWYHLIFHLYGLAAGLTLIIVGTWVIRKDGWPSKLLTSIGVCSFGIYFTHPGILTLWRVKVEPPSDLISYHLYSIAGFFTAFLGAWLLTYSYKRITLMFSKKRTSR
ncbi:acyltransferase [Paenibacillus sp. GCM10023252]|uniref:acyltransferase n=1 Tax=Paenibacillus sp. GCM10023252 TaxID=3252649 RepID=UPI00361EE794